MNLQKTCLLAAIHSFTLLSGQKIQSHTYAIEKQRQIINKDEQFSARSSIQCAAECSENAFCCTGTFDYQTKQCSISMNCFPETEVAANGFMFTNVQRKGKFYIIFYFLVSRIFDQIYIDVNTKIILD